MISCVAIRAVWALDNETSFYNFVNEFASVCGKIKGHSKLGSPVMSVITKVSRTLHMNRGHLLLPGERRSGDPAGPGEAHDGFAAASIWELI